MREPGGQAPNPTQDVQSFIGSSFRSVWALEVLCYLRGQRNTAVSAQALVEVLRASLTVQRHMLALAAVGTLIFGFVWDLER